MGDERDSTLFEIWPFHDVCASDRDDDDDVAVVDVDAQEERVNTLPPVATDVPTTACSNKAPRSCQVMTISLHECGRAAISEHHVEGESDSDTDVESNWNGDRKVDKSDDIILLPANTTIAFDSCNSCMHMQVLKLIFDQCTGSQIQIV